MEALFAGLVVFVVVLGPLLVVHAVVSAIVVVLGIDLDKVRLP